MKERKGNFHRANSTFIRFPLCRPSRYWALQVFTLRLITLSFPPSGPGFRETDSAPLYHPIYRLESFLSLLYFFSCIG